MKTINATELKRMLKSGEIVVFDSADETAWCSFGKSYIGKTFKTTFNGRLVCSTKSFAEFYKHLNNLIAKYDLVIVRTEEQSNDSPEQV